MLLRFSVSNFLSFDKTQIFSMAAGKIQKHSDHLNYFQGKRVLKGGFIFGANASGKSNFVKAIDYSRRVILKGEDCSSPAVKYFRIADENSNNPGVFQYDLIAGDRVYSYGFAIDYLTHRFVCEWLYDVTNGEELKTCYFDREINEQGNEYSDDSWLAGKLAEDNEKEKMRFNIYSEDVKPEKLLLHEIVSRSKNEGEFQTFYNVFDFFTRITVMFPDTYTPGVVSYARSDQAFSEKLKYFDTGIEKITSEEIEIEKILETLPSRLGERIVDDLSSEEFNDGHLNLELAFNMKRYIFSKKKYKLVGETLKISHGNTNDPFEFGDESDGTKRLFDLYPIYSKGNSYRLFVIDELDRSLHSKLVQKLIEKFYEINSDNNIQMICTTHDSNVMDLDLLRRDEIWLMEREEDHSSTLYSLNQYNPRFDKKVSKDYLMGRYGAVPVFNEIDWDEGE